MPIRKRNMPNRNDFNELKTKEDIIELLRNLSEEYKEKGSKWDFNTVDQVFEQMAAVIENNGIQTKLNLKKDGISWNDLSKIIWELSIWDIG